LEKGFETKLIGGFFITANISAPRSYLVNGTITNEDASYNVPALRMGRYDTTIGMSFRFGSFDECKKNAANNPAPRRH
jgi:hypothetical protein